MAINKATGDYLSHLKLEIRVDRLSDHFSLDLPRDDLIFVRYYIFAGNGERIRVDTREVSPSVIPVWDEVAAMECQGRVGRLLEPHTAVFELRRRPRTRSLLSSGSKLLGRAEVAWKEVLASPNMSMRRCVRFGSLSSEWNGGVKTPGLLVEMKVEAMEFSATSSTQRVAMERRGRRKSEGFGSEEEMLLAAATMNAW
ncbi:uncharacterized protein LOC141832795 [Curcuma longa]|uniref:uncharacterized protein LOC141832795 n=1 Tax=Curcuma longa TaxID=136217 RepID=UPI003D9F93DC